MNLNNIESDILRDIPYLGKLDSYEMEVYVDTLSKFSKNYIEKLHLDVKETCKSETLINKISSFDFCGELYSTIKIYVIYVFNSNNYENIADFISNNIEAVYGDHDSGFYFSKAIKTQFQEILEREFPKDANGNLHPILEKEEVKFLLNYMSIDTNNFPINNKVSY